MNPQQLAFLAANPGADLSTSAGQQAFQQWVTSNPTNGSGTAPNTLALNSLTAAGAPTTSPTAALNQAISGSQSGGNTDQVQGSQQSGNFASTGNTNTTGNTTQQSNTSNTTSGNQQQVGTTSNNEQQNTAGNTNTTGNLATSGTSTAIDSLGLGSLLASAGPQASASTGASQNFLQGVLGNGNPLLQAQTSQAVNNSLSGPGMVGAGNGAQARAAGDAAGNVALNSQGQQISAAEGLGGPTALTTLAAAGNPFVGTSTAGNQTSSGSQSSTGMSDSSGSTLSAQDLSSLSNSLNLSSLAGTSNTNTNEAQSGSSAATSAQEAIGQVPQSQTSSGSGCYVCTAYVELGLMHRAPIQRAARYKLAESRYDRPLAGYSVYGPALARGVLRSPRFARIFLPVARAILYHEGYLAHKRSVQRLIPTLIHAVFHYGSLPFAWVSGRKKMKADAGTIAFLERNKLHFHG